MVALDDMRPMAKSNLDDNLTRAQLDHLDLERIRIETMLRRDGRRFLFQLIGLLVAAMVAGAAIWEAIKP
jgi:hypothetical protein